MTEYSNKGKSKPVLSFIHKAFLKHGFEKINLPPISIHQDHLEIAGQRVKLLPVAEFPEYTNEVLQEMAISELISLATDFGFNPKVYHSRNMQQLIKSYGEQKSRQILKGYVYTHKDNHPVRCFAIAKKSGNLVDLGKSLWTYLKLSEISNRKYNIMGYTKPARHICSSLELSLPNLYQHV